MKTVLRASVWAGTIAAGLVAAVYIWAYHQLAIEVEAQRAHTERLQLQIDAMREAQAGQLERLRR